jgi:uncharacterized OB-fold protein
MIVPRYTREIPQRFRLEAGTCKQCAYLAFPPRLICPKCGHKDFQSIKLKPQGKILTYTIVHVADDDFSIETPFAVGIIETDEGARLTAQIVDCDFSEIEIGKKVILVFRRIRKEGHAGILQYGYKAILMREMD